MSSPKTEDDDGDVPRHVPALEMVVPEPEEPLQQDDDEESERLAATEGGSSSSNCPAPFKHKTLQKLRGDWFSYGRKGWSSHLRADVDTTARFPTLDVINLQQDEESAVATITPDFDEEDERGGALLKVLEVASRENEKHYKLKSLDFEDEVIWTNSEGIEVDTWDRPFALSFINAVTAYSQYSGLDARLKTCYEALGVVPKEDRFKPGKHKIALCSAHKNRRWQVEASLPITLMHCWPHRHWVRIHFVDFDSVDETVDWILKHCKPALKNGLLRLYTSEYLPSWHASIGKNTAHMMAEEDEDILVNLDADNVVFGEWLKQLLMQISNGATVVQCYGTNGTCGRIACFRKDWRWIRGYDEDAFPMGCQDIDLRDRLAKLPQAKLVKDHINSEAIPNSSSEKISNVAEEFRNVPWTQMDHANRYIFKKRLSVGQIVRNMHKPQLGVQAHLVSVA